MISYYLKQSIRQLASRKLTTLIQIIGLGIGLGSVILMVTFILHEYSFDKYHRNSGNIYRVVYEKDCSTPYVMGELFGEEIPGISQTFRIYSLWNMTIKHNEEFIKEDNFILADSAMFSSLDIPLLAGNKRLLYQNTTDVVISDKAAIKYFDDSDPVGQPLEISVSGKYVLCNISGVFKSFPSNSSIQADFLGNIKLTEIASADQTLRFSSGEIADKPLDKWEQKGYLTFLVLSNNRNVKEVEKQATRLCQKYDKDNNQKQIYLQPLTAMYFNSEDLSNYAPLTISNHTSIRIFEGIAILILLVAWFNYLLLSNAETRARVKGIACRKIIGATSLQIAQSTYVQSLLTVILSLLPALLFTSLLVPLFNQLFDKNIDLQLLLKPGYLAVFIGVAIITGLAGGTYVSLYTMRLIPVDLFRNAFGRKSLQSGLPSGSILVFQFTVFIVLVGSAILIGKQVRFSESKSPGFNSKDVLVFKLNNQELRDKVNVIKSELEANPHVKNVAISAFTPPSTGFIKLAIGEDKNSEPIKEEALFIGSNLIELLEIPVVEGSSFGEGGEHNGELVLNEMAAEKYRVKAGDQLGGFKIRGILKDFHVHSVHRAIAPLFMLKMNDEGCYELTVRSDGNDKAVIDNVRKIWSEILPTALFEYELLDDRITSFYDKEKKQVKTISFFSSLAIFLSAMGLFGFVSITLLRRTKEIGIRKVNGAKVIEVLAMLNRDFVKWVIVSFLLACPVIWFAMNKWLQNFAYRTEISWWVFGAAGTVAVTVAIATISWLSWRTATRNPVEALRYE